jgi:xanthine dehydrogenase accessory factor
VKNIFLHIPKSGHAIEDLVLAMVVKTAGSTPQKAGTSALFTRSGLESGTIGGGILEGKVAGIAGKAADSRKSGLYRFRLDKSAPAGEDALCGGSVSVLIDPDLGKHFSVIKQVNESISARIPGVIVTLVSNIYAESVIINRFWSTSPVLPDFTEEVQAIIRPELLDMLDNPDPYDFRELELTLPGEETASLFYLQSVVPPPRLVIAGAGHIGKALSGIAQMLDFDITVIDDRDEYANRDNIPAADHILVGNMGKLIAGIEKNSDTYIVIVTRGHRDDSSVLRACIGSGADYIGMIGSRNKISLVHDEFVSNGWATEEQWRRIFAPVGIDINSKSVEEIAVSIAAQLIQVRNKSKGRGGRPKTEAGKEKNAAK